MSADLAALAELGPGRERFWQIVFLLTDNSEGLSEREKAALRVMLQEDERAIERETGRATSRPPKPRAMRPESYQAARQRIGLPAKPRPRSKSEADRLRANRWTRDDMIRALKAHGYPGRRAYQRLHKADPGIPGDYAVWREYGSWAKALEAARRSRL